MRWFKHMTDTSQDDKIVRLIDRFGMEGYGAFWRVQELIANQISPEKAQVSVCFSVKSWRNFTGFTKKRLTDFLNLCEKVELFEVIFEGADITVASPNLLKYRDEYQRKYEKKGAKSPDTVSGPSPDNIRSDSGPTPEEESDTDTDTESDADPEPPPTDNTVDSSNPPKPENPEASQPVSQSPDDWFPTVEPIDVRDSWFTFRANRGKPNDRASLYNAISQLRPLTPEQRATVIAAALERGHVALAAYHFAVLDLPVEVPPDLPEPSEPEPDPEPVYYDSTGNPIDENGNRLEVTA